MKTILPLTIGLVSWTASQAASLSVSASGYVSYDSIEGPVYSYFCENAGTTSASCINPTGEVSATAEASYGEVRVEVTTSRPIGMPGYNPLGSFGDARASVNDALTILGGVGTGTLRYRYLWTYFPLLGPTAFGGVGSGLNNCVSDICETPFTFGSPIGLYLEASASGLTPDEHGSDPHGNGFVRIDRFTIFDAEGRALPSYYISAESGTRYQTLQAAPEPATALLIFAAGLGLTLTRRLNRATPPGGSNATTPTRD